MNHPRNSIRDTSNYPVFRKLNSGKKPSLKLLASSILGMEIQESSHCSVTDASIAMLLYKRHRDDWEKSLNMCQKDKSDAQDKSVEKAPLLAQNSNAIRKKRQKMSRKRINKNKLVL